LIPPDPRTPTSSGRSHVPRVAIDAGAVVGPRTGVGLATVGLLEALGRAWPADWPAPIAWINSPRHPLPEGDRWLTDGRFEVRHTRYSGKALLRGWQWLDRPPLERWLGPIGLVHSPSGVVPSVRRARRIVTVYDLYFRHRLEHTDAYGGRYFNATYGRRLPRVDAVVCISEFTRAELLRFYPIPAEKVHVIRLAVDGERFRPAAGMGAAGAAASPAAAPGANDNALSDAAHLAALGLKPPYLLCVATHEPRKNLPRLIEAAAALEPLLRERGLATPLLALVGRDGWGNVEIERLARRAGVADRFRLLGYLADERMPALYRGAMALVFPSLYEGFGLPALEAMACGCPCVLSRIEAHREVAGDAAAWFDPDDAEALARLMAEVVAGADLREKLRAAGLARARTFSWAAAARDTLDLYRKLLFA
jgi:alpha-1,3-rhamnosyl/mannosyltransferase